MKQSIAVVLWSGRRQAWEWFGGFCGHHNEVTLDLCGYTLDLCGAYMAPGS
jgi:hypothetical protein